MPARPMPTVVRRARVTPTAAPRTRSVLAAVLVILGVVLGPGATVSGAAATPEQVATALQRSPVYIDQALDGVISPTAGRRIARTVRGLDQDVYVALVPLAEGDRFGGKPRAFLAALRSRFPKDGVFVTADDGYLTVQRIQDGAEDRDEALQDAETIANFIADRRGTERPTLLQRVETFLRLLRQPPEQLAARVQAYEEQSERESKARGSSSSPFRGDRGDDGGGVGLVFVLAALLVLAGVLGTVVLRRRRSGATPSEGPLPVVPEHVFEHARAAERAELQEDADRELLALATQLDEQPVPDREDAQDAYQRALDAYTAARRRAGDDAPAIDLVGILVLVDQARGDLARAAALDAGRRVVVQPPLCAFDPLHGRSATTVRWERGLKIPACTACAADVHAGRTPDARRDGGEPYFERDTVWARTGFGAFSDDLVERVGRGER